MRSKRQMPCLLFLALLLVLCAWLPGTTLANEEAETIPATDNDDDDTYGDDEVDSVAVMARAIFPGSAGAVAPTLHAGSPTDALLAYRHQQMGHRHTVILVVGYLSQPNTQGQVMQNFSVVRHARTVNPEETVNFQYRFTPSVMLEPSDYKLILGLYCHDNITNNTFFVSAFNGTVTVEESLSTDPKTLLTYVTLLGLLGVATYLVATKIGLVSILKGLRKSGSKGRRRVEVGTNGEGYDPDYIAREHQRYREAVLQRHSSSSPKKKK